MPLSSAVIGQIESELKVSCRPHLVFPPDLGQRTDEGCLEFDIPKDSETVWIISQRLDEFSKTLKGLPDQEKLARQKQAFPFIEESALQSHMLDLGDLYDPSLGVNTLLAQTRKILTLSNEPAIAYRGNLDAQNPIVGLADQVVVAPTTDQFESLRYEGTNASQYDLFPQNLIQKLKELDAIYGIDIVGAGVWGVDFLLKRLPTDEEALALLKWIDGLYPDNWADESPTIFKKGRIALLWP